MAAQPPPSSSSSRRPRTGDRAVGMFSIEDEIGKGSFATVYRGTHKVRYPLSVQRGGSTCSYPGDSVSDERYRRPAVLKV
jgi:hypothetical protein